MSGTSQDAFAALVAEARRLPPADLAREIGALVSCPDWNDRAECGGGLHGLLDGIGDWALTSPEPDALWWIIGVLRTECVVIDQDKVKVPRGRVEYFGSFAGAMNMIAAQTAKRLLELAEGNIATGDSGHAAVKGVNAIAFSGGRAGTASADKGGWIVLAEYQECDPYDLITVRCGRIGEGELEAGATYQLKAGEFVPVEAS